MDKIITEETEVFTKDGVEYYSSYVIPCNKVSVIEGKLLTTAELLGLPKEQIDALKSQIRQIIWGRGFLSYAWSISGEQAHSVSKYKEEIKQPEQTYTALEVTNLLNTGVITKDEARELLKI